MTLFSAVIIEDGALTVRRSDQAVMLKHSFGIVGKWWHNQRRRKHFTRGAFQLYREYTPRAPGYAAFKRRHGLYRPLVASGNTERASANKTIRATRNGVTITYRLPVLNFRARGSRVNKVAEFQAVNSREEQTASERAVKDLNRQYNTFQRTRKRVI